MEDAHVRRLRPGSSHQGAGGTPSGRCDLRLSPAQKAGLHAKDVIVTVGGEPVVTGSDLLAILAKRRPGEQVTIEFYRGEERHTVVVKLAKQPDGN